MPEERGEQDRRSDDEDEVWAQLVAAFEGESAPERTRPPAEGPGAGERRDRSDRTRNGHRYERPVEDPAEPGRTGGPHGTPSAGPTDGGGPRGLGDHGPDRDGDQDGEQDGDGSPDRDPDLDRPRRSDGSDGVHDDGDRHDGDQDSGDQDSGEDDTDGGRDGDRSGSGGGGTVRTVRGIVMMTGALSEPAAPGPRDYSPPEEDEGHFVPPPPPPLPRVDSTTKFAWIAVLGGPLLLFLMVVLQQPVAWWMIVLGVGGFLGGFATLVARMKDGDEDDPDGGAVV